MVRGSRAIGSFRRPEPKMDSLGELNEVKGFKAVHLNICSLPKKMDQLKLIMFDSKIDVLTISETWLSPHLCNGTYELEGYTSYRQDRRSKAKKGKRGGGLITYVNNKHASLSESLDGLNISGEHIEAQWVLIHRPHCKNVIMCNVYRPPNGNLQVAVSYLDECLKFINLRKIDVFVIGDMNVSYQTKSSQNNKKLLFFSQSRPW